MADPPTADLHTDAPTLPPLADEDADTRRWRALLTGEDRLLPHLRRFWRHVPSAPRCKVCASPFHGAGGAVARVFWHGPLKDNPLLCRACFGVLAQHPGGAEVNISVLFADVRGSTGLAERISPSAYRSLIQAYYRLAARAIDDNGGIIDKYLGDGIMALFIPVIAGENHAARSIAAGRALLEAVEREDLSGRGLMIGAGVHTGEAFVGAIGGDEKIDFTALGDTVNIAARLGSVASSGELIVSQVAWASAGLDESSDERQIDIAGRTGKLTVISIGPAIDSRSQPA
jgi:adenylate cyclase